jgi:hypothetical protein
LSSSQFATKALRRNAAPAQLRGAVSAIYARLCNLSRALSLLREIPDSYRNLQGHKHLSTMRPKIAATGFFGGKYDEYASKSEVVLYRIYSGYEASQRLALCLGEAAALAPIILYNEPTQ